MSSDLTIDDPINLSGMSLLINTNNVPPGYNPQDIERSIIGHQSKQQRVQTPSYTQDLESQIDKLTSGYSQPSWVNPQQIMPSNQSNSGMSEIDQLISSMTSSASSSAPNTADNFSYATTPTSQSSNYYSSYPNSPSPSPFNDYQDPTLNYMTNEEKRQSVIGEVFNDINKENTHSIFSMEKEKEEDDKQRKLEHISYLTENLVGEGEDLSNIPKVNGTNSLSEIDNVLTRLLLRNDRKRCGSFAEEVILLGAHGIEWLCDGKKSYFGYKPDMIDWHKSVSTKLRRMRYDTSNVVSKIMEEYKLGSGTRIFLELIPSMFLYSRMRKSQHKDTITDDEFNVGINKLRDLEVSSE